MPTFHLPYNHHLIELARNMRQNPTPAERKLWCEYLRNVPVRVLRQKPIDRFIVDFYCASVKLAIEIDGEQHFRFEVGPICFDLIAFGTLQRTGVGTID